MLASRVSDEAKKVVSAKTYTRQLQNTLPMAGKHHRRTAALRKEVGDCRPADTA